MSEQSGERTEQKFAACPQCLRFVESPEDADGIVARHNESRHDDEQVAIVIEDDTEDLARLLDHAISILAEDDELVTDDQFHKLVMKFRQGDLPFHVPSSRWQEILDSAVYAGAISTFGRYRRLPSPGEWVPKFYEAEVTEA